MRWHSIQNIPECERCYIGLLQLCERQQYGRIIAWIIRGWTESSPECHTKMSTIRSFVFARLSSRSNQRTYSLCRSANIWFISVQKFHRKMEHWSNEYLRCIEANLTSNQQWLEWIVCIFYPFRLLLKLLNSFIWIIIPTKNYGTNFVRPHPCFCAHWIDVQFCELTLKWNDSFTSFLLFELFLSAVV